MRKSEQKMNKKKLFVLCATGLLFLGGCGSGSVEAMSDNYLQDVIFENEDMAKGYSYYEQSEAEKAKEGEKVADEAVKEEQQEQVEQIDTTGKVKVTFAENSLLNVSYYSDAALTTKIEKENCYLEPEACIYASVPESKTGTSSKYKFDGFRIYEFDENGDKKLKETILPLEDKLVYQISAVTEGDGIAIVPVGTYEKRVITLSDYVVNANGEKQELKGTTWKVNNKDWVDEVMEINPLTSYVVSYEYDENEYYYVSATPESACHYPKESGNTDGEVFFRVQESESTIEKFSVELQKYRTVTIDNEAQGLLSAKIINDGRTFTAKDKVEMDRLQCGYTLEIKTDKAHKLVTTSKYEFSTVKDAGDGYVYTFVVPKTAEGDIKFNVYAWAKKEIDITLDGEKTGTSWWDKLFGKDKNKEQQSILTIRVGGVDYPYEKLKTGEKLSLNENDKLEIISAGPNIPEGVQVHVVIDNKETFVVNSSSDIVDKELSYDDISKSLRITVLDMEEANIALKKAELKVTLGESLKNSKNILFSLEASGGEDRVTEAYYIKDKETIFDGVIDAEQKLVLSAKNIQLYDDTALKINIKRNDGTQEIRYCDSSYMYETISLVKSNTGGITEYYSELDISISLVDVYTYKTHKGSNYTVSVCLADTNQTKLLDGDILEGSRKVVMTITAADGYYIEGDKYVEKNTIYRREMEYSDYVEQIDTILSKNPVKKFITASVDVTAPYQAGTVTVIVNGKVHITETDTYWFMEDDEIKFTLELNKDSGYYIVGTGLWDKDLDGKRTETIIVTPEMEGTVISVGDCIEVKKEN